MGALKAAIPIVISAIAVTLSIVTYMNSVKAAKISLWAAEQMQIYHDKDQAIYFHVPIVFQNSGAQAGVVRSLGLILRDPGTKEAIFIKWTGFLKPEGGTWAWDSNATPLSVPAHSEVPQMTQFYGAGGLTGWLPKPIEYDMYLLAWTSDSQTPSVRYVAKWMFSEKDVSAIKLNLEKTLVGCEICSLWVSRSGYAPDSKRLSASEFNELVRQ
jgi:hypothetical protein